MSNSHKAALAGLSMAACLAGSALANPYAEYEGTTLIVNFPAHPHCDAVRKILPEFTKETGIEVEVHQPPYLKMRERQTLGLGQDEGEYDLIAYVVFSKADYIFADQLENLAKYFMNPKLADSNYDSGDLIDGYDGYVYNIGFAGGEKSYLEGKTGLLFGIPYGSETSILGYRKDMFEKHGLEVPETYDEKLEIACQIPKLEPGMDGVASRAASGHHALHAFLLHLAPLGGRVFDDQWNPIVNNEANVQAAEALNTIIGCGPEGAKNFGFGEALGVGPNGDTAMFLDTTVVAGQIDDPSKSQLLARCVGCFTRWACGAAARPVGSASASHRMRKQESRIPVDAMADLEKRRQAGRSDRRQYIAILDP